MFKKVLIILCFSFQVSKLHLALRVLKGKGVLPDAICFILPTTNSAQRAMEGTSKLLD